MLDFLKNNWGTIVAGVILAALVVSIIVGMIKTKKAGKCIGCSSCDGCKKSGSCKGGSTDPRTDKNQPKTK